MYGTGNHVQQEDLLELVFVPRLEQRLDRTCRQFGKGIISAIENGEGARTFESGDKVGGTDGSGHFLGRSRSPPLRAG